MLDCIIIGTGASGLEIADGHIVTDRQMEMLLHTVLFLILQNKYLFYKVAMRQLVCYDIEAKNTEI